MEQQEKMPSPSQKDATPVAAEEEVCKMNDGILSGPAEAEEAQDDHDLFCISGEKPFFDIILTKSQVTPHYSSNVPTQAVRNLPRDDAVVVFMHGGREWKFQYNGKAKRPRFLVSEWKAFVLDNNLKCEDACIFEVVESTPTMAKLKVVILRGTNLLPPELQAEVDSYGRTPEKAIEID